MQRRLKIIMDESKKILPDGKNNYVVTSHYITTGSSKVEAAVNTAIDNGRSILVLYPNNEI